MINTMLQRIEEWAKKQNNIRLVVLEGYLAGEVYVDDLSDIDVNLFCTSYQEFLDNDSWISAFGDILVYIPEKFQFAEADVITRLVIFDNGVKVDFSFWTMDLLQKIINKTDKYYKNGHKVLVDKVGASEKLPIPEKENKCSAPTLQQFESQVNAFWFDIHYIAKFLFREEIWFVKHVDSFIKNEKFLQIIEWYAGAMNDWQINTHFKGRHMKEWLTKEDYNDICKLFSDSNLENNWQSLFLSLEVFRKMAVVIANKMNFPYSHKADKKMSDLIRNIYLNQQKIYSRLTEVRWNNGV